MRGMLGCIFLLKSLGMDGLKVYVREILWMIGWFIIDDIERLCCWLVRHRISRDIAVIFLPSVKYDRNMASKSCADDADVCVFVLKSLGMYVLIL